jgi:hypothetical protein
MTAPTDLSVVRGKKQAEDACLYCGGKPHKTILCCPRIAMVHIDPETACITGITFFGDFFDEEPEIDPAA